MAEYLFVYGSLRRAAQHPMHEFLTWYAAPVGEATFPGILFSLGDYPGAVPSADAVPGVKGEVYEIRDAPALLNPLDDYEDYWLSRPTESLYLRQVHSVRLSKTNALLSAWVYVYNRPTAGLPVVVSGDWLEEAS